MKLRFLFLLSWLIASLMAMADGASKNVDIVMLHPRDAKIDGTAKYYSEHEDIGYWVDQKTKVGWDFDLPRAGNYRVIIAYGCINESAGTSFDVVIGNQKANGIVQATGNWLKHKEFDLGPVIFRKAGAMRLEVVPIEKPPGAQAVMNLRYVKLVREE
jgi:hypothetical protein